MKNKRFRIMTIFLLVLLFAACSNKDENIDTSPKSVDELINNMDNVIDESITTEKPSKKEEVKEDRSEAKKNWEKSLAKNKDNEVKEEKPKKKILNFEEEDNEEYTKKARIKFFGDTMAHFDQVQYAINYGGGEYDFSNQFTYISDYVKDADLSITNYETTTNPNREYSGYPAFNTPVEYLKNIKDAGFDVVTTANNHTLDTDEEGVFSTIDAIENAGLDYVGTHKDDGERILYKDVNGIKVAILSYTYGCNGKVDLLTVREEVDSVNYIHDDLIKKISKKQKIMELTL